MFVSPQYSYVKILTPSRMVLGGGVFEKELGHENRALRNGISILIKRNARKMISTSQPCEHTKRRRPSANKEEGSHQISDLSAP